MEKIEQYVKIAYWAVGVVGWIYFILACRQVLLKYEKEGIK